MPKIPRKSLRPEFLEPPPVSPRSQHPAVLSPYERVSLLHQAEFLEQLLTRITQNVGLSANDLVRYCDAEAALELIYEELEELET